jgi:hypothetical protein
MALNIPLPELTGDTLRKAFATGSNMYSNIMNPIISREQMANQKKMQESQLAQQKQLQEAQLAQAWKRHIDELALRKQQEARLAANMGLQQQLLQHKLKGLKFDEAMQQMLMGGANTYPQQKMSHPNQEVGEGNGAFSQQGLQEAQQPQQQAPQASPQGAPGMNFDMLRQNPMLRGFFKHKFGFDPLAPAPETPDQKRAADLQSKMDLENLKTDNKAKAIEQKELVAVKKDLPTLEKSLKGVDELMRIAKQNPEMFGHGFMPDRFAKTTKIKDFGKWQNLISDAIAGLEQKLSARGNVVALKLASQLKPSHAEQQDVAIGKLESMRQQLVDTINNSKKKLGQNPLQNDSSSQYKDDDLVVVEGPNGDETMTYAQAKALGAE